MYVRFCLFTLTPVFKPVYILVKNHAHKRGYLTCLLYQGFYKLKSLIIYFNLAEVHNVRQFLTRKTSQSYLLFM